MVFDKPKLSFGTVAVGTEKEMIVKLKNQGHHSGVYVVDGLDERQGIRVNPDRALILPGEFAEISVVVSPKMAMSYDNSLVTSIFVVKSPSLLSFQGIHLPRSKSRSQVLLCQILLLVANIVLLLLLRMNQTLWHV